MNYHFLPDQAGDCWEPACLDGNQLGPLNGKSTHAEPLPSDSATGCCLSSLSGIWTLENLTEELPQATRAWLMSLRGGSLVNPSVMQASEKGKTIIETCGRQHGSASAWLDPDSACLKTFQACLLADISEPSLATFPKAGIVCAGEFFPQPSWEHRTREIGFGLLPTINANEPGWRVGGSVEVVDKEGNQPEHWNQRFYDKKTGRLVQKGLGQVAEMFPTPRANEQGSYQYDRGDHSKPRPTLAGYAKAWPTPTAGDGGSGASDKGRQGGMNLRSAVKFHTPTVHDANPIRRSIEGWQKRKELRQSMGRDHIAPAGLSEQLYLAEQGIPLKISEWDEVDQMFPTPTASNTKAVHHRLGTPNSRGIDGGSNQRKAAKENGTHVVTSGGQLNPDWVEWLMGWPLGWTSLEPMTLGNLDYGDPVWWAIEPPDIPRIAKGIPERQNRLKGLGNGQVPVCVAMAWHLLRG